MADTPENTTPEAAAGAAKTEAATQPSLNILSQYIKDLSFENPGAPKSLIGNSEAPEINISVNVGAEKVEDDVFAVELTLVSKAERSGDVLFNCELVYGGVFRIAGFSDEQIHPVVMIECPRMIFPFARQVFAAVTQQGGFPPLMLDPVDFASIYAQNIKAAAEATKQ